MFIIGNFLLSIGKLINFLIGLYIWVVVIRALMSWINPDPFNKFSQLLEDITEPVLRPIRRMLPTDFGIDLSPIAAILLLYFLKSFIGQTLIDIGIRMR